MIRRGRTAIKKQSSECAYHDQAWAQCFEEAVERVGLPLSGVRAALQRSNCRRERSARAKQSSGRAMQGDSKNVHAVERGFWSAGKNMSWIPAAGQKNPLIVTLNMYARRPKVSSFEVRNHPGRGGSSSAQPEI